MLTMRLTQRLYEEALSDLRRPHAFAAERIGFLYGRLAFAAEPTILLNGYSSVPDDTYIDDSGVGARVDGDAFRAAMENALSSGDGLFHTHLHDWPGRPEFSHVDREDLPKFMPAFQTVASGEAVGLFLFSSDSATADVWLPKRDFPQRASRISVVGFPLSFMEG